MNQQFLEANLVSSYLCTLLEWQYIGSVQVSAITFLWKENLGNQLSNKMPKGTCSDGQHYGALL